MANYGNRVGDLYKTDAGNWILNNLPEAERRIAEKSLQMLEDAGVKTKASTKYALEQAQLGRVISSDWLNQARTAAYEKGAIFRDMHARNAYNATELARMQALRGIGVLDNPMVQGTLGALGNAGATLREYGPLAATIPVGMALGVGAWHLKDSAGKAVDNLSDAWERVQSKQEDDTNSYLSDKSENLFIPEEESKKKYHYGDIVVDEDSMD